MTTIVVIPHVGAVRFALAEKVGGSTALADRAWRLLQLAIESRRAGLVSAGWPTLQFLVHTGIENGPFTL